MTASTRKQLNVRSERAHALAHRLARAEGVTAQQVVERALIASAEDRHAGESGNGVAQDTEYQRLMALAREFRASWRELRRLPRLRRRAVPPRPPAVQE